MEKMTEAERLDVLEALTRVGRGSGKAYDWFFVNEDDYVPCLGSFDELTPDRIIEALNQVNDTEGLALYLTQRAMQKLEAEPSETDPHLPSGLPFTDVPVRLVGDPASTGHR